MHVPDATHIDNKLKSWSGGPLAAVKVSAFGQGAETQTMCANGAVFDARSCAEVSMKCASGDISIERGMS